MISPITYQAALSVAATVESHFAFHLTEAINRGETDLATGPTADIVEAIIDVSFWASLLHEEGHFPKISLAFLSPDQSEQPLIFDHPLPFKPSILTKLAPAVERPGIHLGIWFEGNELQVWGITRSLPSCCFVLEVIEPGLLVVKHRRVDGFGKYLNVAILKGDQVKVVDQQSARMPDCPDLLTSMLGFVTPSTWNHSVNVLVELAASMRAHGRGGTLLVVPADSKNWRESIINPIKYAVSPAFCGLADLMRRKEKEENQGHWMSSLSREVETVAGLTAVDGATLISDQYELMAFGAKIGRPDGNPPVSRMLVTEPIVGKKSRIVHPAQSGGTRHLSAAQFVQDQHDSIALVASQDGRFTLFSWAPCEDMVQAHRVDSLLL